MAVTRRLRFEILTRDGHRCRYCGATADEAKLTIDHVIPVALGGSDDPTNLYTACQPCNAGKSSVPPTAELVAQVADDALRFARALELVTAQRRAAIAEVAANVTWFDQRWCRWTYVGSDNERHTVERDDDWRTSVERFFAAGLDRVDIDVLIDAAVGYKKAYDTWRFFCGKAWQEIRERQESARLMLAEPPSGDGPATPSSLYDEGYDTGYYEGSADARSELAVELEAARELADTAYERGFRDGVARARQTPDGADPRPPWGE